MSVTYNTKDISKELNQYCKSFSYNDVMSGAADDIEIILEDKDQLWQNDWLPEKGDTIRAKLIVESWTDGNDIDRELDLGLFEVDEIESTGFPSEVTIRGVSIPNSSKLRGTYKSRSWEKAKLSLIANDIATGAGLELLYDTEDDPQLERAEQTEQTDLSFLMRVCRDAGLALKITDNQVVIFDVQKYEAKLPIKIIKKNKDTVARYSIKSKIRDIYDSCRVTYQSGKKKEKIEAAFERPDKINSGQVLVVNEQVESIGEAEKLAKKRLRAANQEEVTANITVIGDVIYTAGSTVLLWGFGKFDGKYIIKNCSHSIGDEYTVILELRRVLHGY